MLLLQKTRNEPSAAFMLLEVILSVLVIATGLLFVIQAYSTSLKGSKAARQTAKASLFLEDRLFEMDVKGFRDGVKEDETDGYIEGEPEHRWYMRASPLDNEKEINRVSLGLVWKGRAITISTMRKFKEG